MAELHREAEGSGGDLSAESSLHVRRAKLAFAVRTTGRRGLGTLPGQQENIPDGWIKHPGITVLVPAPGLTALASNNHFATTRNGQVSSNHFLQHTFF